jgi:CBS domain-containing protein
MQLKDICTSEVVFCERQTTVRQAAEIMRRKHVGDLVVVDDAGDERAPVGVVTDRDIVVKVVGNELDVGRVTVGEIMRTPIVVASETEDASDAIARMRVHGVRRLPIVDARGGLIGIITFDDLLKLLVGDTNALLEVVAKEQDREHRTLR